ncbi:MULTISPECIES: hypothetical protein [Pantoea]|uniref:hypothetical protein n=1 Tax=Pantoea TaxID=53335 RepID=UPI00226A1B65|nr:MULTISPECIES: hypothetical protein [unclassified Pantoea]
MLNPASGGVRVKGFDAQPFDYIAMAGVHTTAAIGSAVYGMKGTGASGGECWLY